MWASVSGKPPQGGKLWRMMGWQHKTDQVTFCSGMFSPVCQEYDWRNYHSSQMSESELQMLASLRRQQNEELEGPGASHGLSASQVDNCNVSISTSSDDTTTWSSCLPPVSPRPCIPAVLPEPEANFFQSTAFPGNNRGAIRRTHPTVNIQSPF